MKREAEPVERPKRRAAIKPPGAYYDPTQQTAEPLTVQEHLNHDQMVSQQLKISQTQLDTLKKLLRTFFSDPKSAEGIKASQLFQKKLRDHNINRKDFDMLTDLSSSEDLLKQAGNASVSLDIRKPDTPTVQLADALALYWNVKLYWDRSGDPILVHFYGPRQDVSTCAHLFLDTYKAMQDLVAVYPGTKSQKQDYKQGLIQGLDLICKDIASQRQKLLEEHKFQVKEENSGALTLASKYVIANNITNAVEEKLDKIQVTRLPLQGIRDRKAYDLGKEHSKIFELEKKLQ